MASIHIFVAAQQLRAVHQSLGDAFAKALEELTRNTFKNHQEFSSESAELREAKSLISHLKYPEATSPLRYDELAWALQYITNVCRTKSLHDVAGIFEQAAGMLGINLAYAQPIPADLVRRIANEMRIRRHVTAEASAMA